jgi:hypothetical protein
MSDVARMLAGAMIVAVVLVTAPAPTPAGTGLERFDRLGISFEYPSSWFVTTERLSDGWDPDYRFAASTVRVKRTRHDKGPCLPGIGRQLPPTAALVFLREYRGASRRRALPRLGPLPRRVRLTPDGVVCGLRRPARGAWIGFRESGRAFILGLHVGPRASKATDRELRRLVASLEIRSRR